MSRIENRVVHLCPVDLEKSYCLCGCDDTGAIVTSSLGRTNCIDCIKVATKIAKDVPDLFAFYKAGIMQDGSVQEKR